MPYRFVPIRRPAPAPAAAARLLLLDPGSVEVAGSRVFDGSDQNLNLDRAAGLWSAGPRAFAIRLRPDALGGSPYILFALTAADGEAWQLTHGGDGSATFRGATAAGLVQGVPSTVVFGWGGGQSFVSVDGGAFAVASSAEPSVAARVAVGSTNFLGGFNANFWAGAVARLASWSRAPDDAIRLATADGPARADLDAGLLADNTHWYEFGGEVDAPVYCRAVATNPVLVPPSRDTWPAAGPPLGAGGTRPDTLGRVVRWACAATARVFDFAATPGSDAEPDFDGIPQSVRLRAASVGVAAGPTLSGRTRYALATPGSWRRGDGGGVLLDDRDADGAGVVYEIDDDGRQRLRHHGAGGTLAAEAEAPQPIHGLRVVAGVAVVDSTSSGDGYSWPSRRFDVELGEAHPWEEGDHVEFVGGGEAHDGVEYPLTDVRPTGISVTLNTDSTPAPAVGCQVVGTGAFQLAANETGSPGSGTLLGHRIEHVPITLERDGDAVAFGGRGGTLGTVTVPGLPAGPTGTDTRLGSSSGACPVRLEGPIEAWDGFDSDWHRLAWLVRAGTHVTNRDEVGLAATRVDLSRVPLVDGPWLAHYRTRIDVLDADDAIVATEEADHTGMPYGSADGFVATFTLGAADLAEDATFRIRVLVADRPFEDDSGATRDAAVLWCGDVATVRRRAVTEANGCLRLYASQSTGSNANAGTSGAAPVQDLEYAWRHLLRPRAYLYGLAGDTWPRNYGFGATGSGYGDEFASRSSHLVTLATYGAPGVATVDAAGQSGRWAIPLAIGRGTRRATASGWDLGWDSDKAIGLDEDMGHGTGVGQGWLLHRVRAIHPTGTGASIYGNTDGDVRRECTLDQVKIAGVEGYGSIVTSAWLGFAWVGYHDEHMVDNGSEHPWRHVNMAHGSLRAWRRRVAGADDSLGNRGIRQTSQRVNVTGIPHDARTFTVIPQTGSFCPPSRNLRVAHVASRETKLGPNPGIFAAAVVAAPFGVGNAEGASYSTAWTQVRRTAIVASYAETSLDGFDVAVGSGALAPGARGALAAPAVALAEANAAGQVAVLADGWATGGVGTDAPWVELWRATDGGVAAKVDGSGRPEMVDEPGPGSHAYHFRAVDAELNAVDGPQSAAVVVA